MRKDVTFKTEDGTELAGWFYAAGTTPAPCIVMAHGFSATKEMHLSGFAETFRDAGMNVLVYDNRNLGNSGGTPRGEIIPEQQIADYRDAITWVQGLDEVDADRIGIWGSSYSGGHVLVVAAKDKRVKCVISQVPLVHGLANAQRLVRSDHWAGLRAGFAADRAGRLAGEAPMTLPVVGNGPEDPCALPTDDSRDFFMGLSEEHRGAWENEITLRSMEAFTEYEPGDWIPKIGPTPLMMVVARQDHLTPADMTLKAYETAIEPKRFLILDCAHFEAYTDEPFKVSAPQQCAWFTEHLM
ncbi:alpha/beta hydrolase [Chachezhania antarctica]|uniref:alpha/beta hydrolase n=1 Tax=Chachezhania antarctica TaxID=2340860 RepID=UPI000EB2FB29|nr:alpha/beta hydrolase [Chachezhania antarctica]|tara:strand:- start:2583 stop:3476 length:894 start_codon:yes stop_codon:yes gene_type:complete